MLLRISIFLMLLPFIGGQATWSASSSVDDTTIAAIHNILHLPLTQIQNALESQNQMREELTRVSNLSATVEDTAIAAVRNILHLPLTQIQNALESQNQMREELTRVSNLSAAVEDTTIAAMHNILHLPLTQIQYALESQNQMRDEVTSLSSQVSNLSAKVEDTAIAAVRNILHLPLTQIQNALESLNQMREDITSLASQVSNLSATVEDTAIAAVRNILHQPLTQIQNALESLNQMREDITSLASQVSNLSATDGTNLFKDCCQLYQAGYRESGVYVMHILDAGQTIPISISCDMETDGGGWLVFQRRQDGSVDFYRDWISYAEGFGNITGEFWLGNKLIHQLTDRKPQQLRIDLHDHEGHTAYAKYGNFYVGPEMTKFALNIGGFSGTAGDGMAYHNNQMFSTKDQDNDAYKDHCAQMRKGGWWYNGCCIANLNGLYVQTGSHNIRVAFQNVYWLRWRGKRYSLKFTEMKIRPQDF